MARILLDTADKSIWVEIRVTAGDIRRGVLACRPGLHRFRGLWYGLAADRPASHGKMLEPRGALPVGRVGRHAPAYLRRKLGSPRVPLRSATKVLPQD